MNSVQAYQKRLRDEVAAVEKEIRSHNQQIEALNKRLEGLKRAVQLVESEQPAIAELLRTNLTDGIGVRPEMTTEPKATWHNGRVKTKTAQAQSRAGKTTQGDGLKRVDLIAAVLKRRSGLNVRDLIAALDKEFAWKATESAVTAHLYTNRKRFVHTKADRSANRPVTWSLK
jgi:hypothetical protein